MVRARHDSGSPRRAAAGGAGRFQWAGATLAPTEGGGCRVLAVAPKSPAARARLEPGDLVVRYARAPRLLAWAGRRWRPWEGREPLRFGARIEVVRGGRRLRRWLPGEVQKSTLREYAESLGIALILALFIRTFVIQAFKIPSGSMLPTLQIGDHIMVAKFIYGPRLEIPFTNISLGHLPGLRQPRRGDVVVFVYPVDPSKDFIKRVVGLPGDRIEIRDKRVYINGKPWDDPHAFFVRGPDGHSGRRPQDNYGPVTVPPGHIFVMGDNRDRSYDSRFWGFVSLDQVKGEALFIYWSWDGNRHWVRWDRIFKPVR